MVVLWAGLLAMGCSGTAEEAAPVVAPSGAGAELYDRLERTYQGRDAQDLTTQLDQRHEDPLVVLRALALQPGMVVADIGCGSGFYTFRLSQAVGDTGTVHALDIQPEAIAFLQQRAAEPGQRRLDNIRPAVTALDDVGLPEASVDLAFMAHLDFYLQPALLPENTRMLESVFRAVRPGGRLAVLQYIAPGQTVDPLVPNLLSVGFTAPEVQHYAEYGSYLVTFSRP